MFSGGFESVFGICGESDSGRLSSLQIPQTIPDKLYEHAQQVCGRTYEIRAVETPFLAESRIKWGKRRKKRKKVRNLLAFLKKNGMLIGNILKRQPYFFQETNSMEKTKKTEIIQKYARKEGDVGSPEVQIALLTAEIIELTEHMRSHKKDHSSRRGLMAMVNRRKKLLKYFSKENHERFLEIVTELGIRGQK